MDRSETSEQGRTPLGRGISMPITFKPGDSFSFADEQGNQILAVSFDMDPGSNLVSIKVFDTDGMPLADMGVSYLGAGYPQWQHFIHKVERSSLPERTVRAHRIIKPARPIETIRRELDSDEPQYATLVPDDPIKEG
jgi:hypothetical protein